MWFLVRWIPRPIRLFVSWFVHQYSVNYLGITFSALTFENGFKYLNSTYWLVPTFLVTVMIVSRGFGLLAISRKAERKENERLAAETPKSPVLVRQTSSEGKVTYKVGGETDGSKKTQ